VLEIDETLNGGEDYNRHWDFSRPIGGAPMAVNVKAEIRRLWAASGQD
jgi:hypothetical protein